MSDKSNATTARGGLARYVIGFMFSPARDRVVLIHKKRPAWQAGRFNAPGGHIEPGETPQSAIIREYAEETGLHWAEWDQFAYLRGRDWEMFCFCSFCPLFRRVRTEEDEVVDVFNVDSIPANALGNIRWLIALALSNDNGKPLHIYECAAARFAEQPPIEPATP